MSTNFCPIESGRGWYKDLPLEGGLALWPCSQGQGHLPAEDVIMGDRASARGLTRPQEAMLEKLAVRGRSASWVSLIGYSFPLESL